MIALFTLSALGSKNPKHAGTDPLHSRYYKKIDIYLMALGKWNGKKINKYVSNIVLLGDYENRNDEGYRRNHDVLEASFREKLLQLDDKLAAQGAIQFRLSVGELKEGDFIRAYNETLKSTAFTIVNVEL